MKLLKKGLMLALVLSLIVLVGSSFSRVKAADTVYSSGTIPSGWQTAGGNQTLNGVSWTYSSSTYIGLNSSKIQVGSSKNPQTSAWTISTAVSNFGSNKVIKSVSITAYTTAATATYDISVGGSSVKSGSLATSSSTYTASDLSESSGNIVITLTGSNTSKAMYISEISVTYGDAQAAGIATITYNANGGTGSMDTQEVSKGTPTALNSNTFLPTTAYSFIGWNTFADGTGTAYSDGANITTDENVTLYAQWAFDSTNYTKVLLHANNGGEPEETKEQVVSKNVATALVSNDFTNGGLGFVKWNTMADGSGTDYVANQDVSISANLNLYAQWGNYSIAEVLADAQSRSYTIHGEITGIYGTSNAVIQDSTGAILLYSYQEITTNKTIKVGNSVTLTGGYTTFNGYGELQNLSNIVADDANDTTVDTEYLTNPSDVTKANQYKLIDLSCLYISSYSSKTATLRDYSFKVYYTTDSFCEGYGNFGASKYVDVKGIVSFKNDTAQVLAFEVENTPQYTLTFNSNGGSSVASYVALKNAKFVAPTNPTKDNDVNGSYAFDGWYLDDETFLQEFDFDTVYNEDKVVYAKWTFTPIAGHVTFTGLSTVANMNFGYNCENNYGSSTSETMSYKSATTSNMTSGNNASVVGLDEDVFTVTADKGKASYYPGLNKNGYFALYYNAGGSNTITVSCNGIIESIEVTFYDNKDNAWFKVNGNLVQGVEGVYTINANSFSMGNNNSSNVQVQIESIVINYKECSYTYSLSQTAFKNNLAMQFAGQINAELKTKLDAEGTNVTYGMIYCKASAIGNDEHISDVAEWLNTSVFDIDALKGLGITVKECTPVGTDATGFAAGVVNYQWGIKLSNISNANIATVMKVAAYVCIDGTYYIMNEKELSVKTLAATYLLPAVDKSTYEEHLGALEWLANYTA